MKTRKSEYTKETRRPKTVGSLSDTHGGFYSYFHSAPMGLVISLTCHQVINVCTFVLLC